MLIYVFGATASGKSRVAEELAISSKRKRIYLATMESGSAEAKERIRKHRSMRNGKGFVTLEQKSGLMKLNLSENLILLECVGNLLANTMFDGGVVHEIQYCVDTVVEDISHLQSRNDLIVVGNDIFGEDIFSNVEYDDITKAYIKALREIHEQLMAKSNRCVEVVCGISIERKYTP